MVKMHAEKKRCVSRVGLLEVRDGPLDPTSADILTATSL